MSMMFQTPIYIYSLNEDQRQKNLYLRKVIQDFFGNKLLDCYDSKEAHNKRKGNAK
jgi:hypothetical protein